MFKHSLWTLLKMSIPPLYIVLSLNMIQRYTCTWFECMFFWKVLHILGILLQHVFCHLYFLFLQWLPLVVLLESYYQYWRATLYLSTKWMMYCWFSRISSFMLRMYYSSTISTWKITMQISVKMHAKTEEVVPRIVITKKTCVTKGYVGYLLLYYVRIKRHRLDTLTLMYIRMCMAIFYVGKKAIPKYE